jgi:hypothetical protein
MTARVSDKHSVARRLDLSRHNSIDSLMKVSNGKYLRRLSIDCRQSRFAVEYDLEAAKRLDTTAFWHPLTREYHAAISITTAVSIPCRFESKGPMGSALLRCLPHTGMEKLFGASTAMMRCVRFASVIRLRGIAENQRLSARSPGERAS